MGKVSFDMGIESVQGMLIGSDPFYIRRYKRLTARLSENVTAPDVARMINHKQVWKDLLKKSN